MDALEKDRTSLLVEAALVTAVFVLPSIAMGAQPLEDPGFLSAQRHLGNLVTFIPQFLLLAYIIGLRGETDEFGLRRPKWKDLALALALFPLVAAVAYGGAALGGLVAAAPPAPVPYSRTPDIPLPLFLPLLAASSLAVGYREEFLYRVYLIRRLQTAGIPDWSAACVSVALFAAGHRYQGIPGILGAAAAGTALSAAYLRRRSLHGLAWAHAAYDVLAILSAAAWV